jgi:hypothetical protein
MTRRLSLFLIATLLLSVQTPAFAAGVTAAPADEGDQYRRTIGLLSAAYLFQTFTVIGAVGDGFAKKAYTEEKARGLLSVSLKLTISVADAFEAMKKMKLPATDRKAVIELNEVAELLVVEAKALSAYIRSEDKSDFRKYNKARKNVWDRLSKLLK